MRRFRFRSIPASSLLALALAACSPGSVPEIPPEHAPQAPSAPAEAVAPAPETVAPSSRLDAEDRAWVERTLAAMSLRQRVAQLVFPWVSGEPAAADRGEHRRMLRWAQEDEVGGLIISRGRPEALAAKLNDAQAHARVPLLVVSDLETGPGMRLAPGGTDFPPSMAFGAADDPALAREAGRVTATEARAVGIHMTLGPVLDVNSNPDNPIINVRSFGEDPERVARLASAWWRGAREGGLLAAGKHFPGHGDTEVDSHVGLATIAADSARLERVELVPFQRAVREGIDGVLVGHIAVAGMEGEGALPASLSPRIVGGVLRERLGFDGLVITDAMNMGAVTRRFSVGEASVRALQAGADVLLQPPGASDVIDRIVAAVEAGRLSRERIDQAARRVLAAKALAGLHQGAQAPLDSLRARVGAPEHQETAQKVAQASITLARDARGLVPLPRNGARVLHVVYTRSGEGSAGAVLDRELAAGGISTERVRVGGRTGTRTYAGLRRKAAAADVVLATVAVSPHQYQALGLQREFADFVEELATAGRPVIALSLGSPYLLDAFPSVPAYLLAWSVSAASERAAARALLARAPIRGRLPVSLPPHLEIGAGVDR